MKMQFYASECTVQSPLQSMYQNSDLLKGPLAIFWDIENCPVPSGVRPEDVAGNIRTALHGHPLTEGAITLFSAYGDFNYFPKRLREGCQRTGVKLVDVPNGKKDAADKAILIDMFLFAMDNRPPSSIMLISGDVDFAPALHVLGQRGYEVILVVRSGAVTSSALKNAGRFVWDWLSLAHGKGLMLPYKQSLSEAANNQSNLILNDDLKCLKGQLVDVLKLSGGMMPLIRLVEEYHRVYGRPLFVSDYGALKLINLLENMSDVVAIGGKGSRRVVYLHCPRSGPVSPNVAPRKRVKKRVKDVLINKVEASTEERSAVENDEVTKNNLTKFKQELEDILVSYSCRIFLGFLEAIYFQRYKRQLDYQSLGVATLEELMSKMTDVVQVHQDPGSNHKYLAPARG